jgi:CO/xanthine dehydrogenase FAD-binding subunit
MQLAALGSDGQVLAGGQSLLPLLRYRVVTPHVLVDINGIDELLGTTWGAHGLRVGALARHADLERLQCPQAPALAALLGAHARQIAFAPVRNRGTAVGSLVQADPKGDWPLVFSALDAHIELASTRTRRTLPVREFIRGPLETARAVDEIATAVTVPPASGKLDAWGRAKIMHRAGEYAMACAIALRRSSEWECWVGAAGDLPRPLPTLASELSADQGSPRQRLMRAAVADIRDAFAELDAVAAHRHAVNAVDAVQNALNEGKV